MLIAKPLCWFCRDTAHLFHRDKLSVLLVSDAFNISIIDIQPPVVDGCPENVELNATQSTALYTWTDPVFTDPMGTELNITSSHATSTYRFPWGDHIVSYMATKLLNGLQTNCSFNVKVRRKYVRYMCIS
jgi:hypothetical protein